MREKNDKVYTHTTYNMFVLSAQRRYSRCVIYIYREYIGIKAYMYVYVANGGVEAFEVLKYVLGVHYGTAVVCTPKYGERVVGCARARAVTTQITPRICDLV